MTIKKHKRFQKAYNKLTKKRRAKVDAALLLFAKDPDNPSLSLHPLTPKESGIFSINVGGDLRCLFVEIEGGVEFIALGTHAKLYG